MMSGAYLFPRRLKLRRTSLMMSCASFAIAAAALAPQPAHAQAAPPAGAFRGSITSQIGSVTRNPTSNTTETITIGSNTATINWSPNDTATGGGAIDFLPTGNVATFTSTPGITYYTVLNRIVPNDPTRSILLDGTVLSTLEGTSATGGNIWFYSPGGIIIGSNAVFDVGGLLLTTADLPNGFSADSNGFSASFSAPSNSLSSVQILPGAQINALQQNSYVAVIAPRVEQGGTVKVDGSAAYVGATSLTMTMDQGLFDIQVDLGGGTDDANGVVHTGSTTGGATASQSANHKVYVVAVPKNNAMTMLLGGTVGFDANVAGYDNGQIVLSSGYNMNDLAGDQQRGYLSDITQPGGIQINPGTYLSDVVAVSNGSISAVAGSGNIDFKGNVSLSSFDPWDDGAITLGASNGNSLDVGGDLVMYSQNPLFQGDTQVKLFADPGSSVTVGGDLNMRAQFYPGYGGTAQIDAFGGTIAIGGLTTVNVDGIDDPSTPYGDQRRGGTINISSTDYVDNQGSITTNGMVLSANGVAHDNSGVEDSQLVNATGGFINVNTAQGGELTVNGNLSAVASAFAGNQATSGFTGGQAQGGEVHVGSVGGTLHVTGNVTVNADATGGDGAPGIDGGAANGGIANVYSAGDGHLAIGGTTLTSASGTGGNGQNGGFGQGGHSGVSSTGGSVVLGGNAYVAATGTGGNASFGFGGTGGSAQGGVAYIEADSSEGGFAGSITGTTATITSDATGGAGGAGDGASIAAGTGGSAIGGFYQGFNTGGAYALADVNGASLSLTGVVVSSSATGGAGGAGGAGQAGGLGGNATGGTAQAGTWNPTATTDRTGSAQFADVDVGAKGRGGDGGSGGAGDGDGGTGTGGGAIFAAAGDTSASNVSLNANGTGGNGANGGAGYGGSGNSGGVLLSAAHDSNMTVSGGIDMSAIGQGGFASTGTGGTGYGGDATIQILSGGSITGGPDGNGGTLPTGDIWVFNKGQGGDGGTGATGGSGGDGYGGNSWLLVDGLLHTGMTTFRTLGVGGTGGMGTDGFGGNGGYGHGGTTIVNIGALGAFDSFAFTGFANGVGGDAGTGTSGSGDGGNAQAGTNNVTIDGEASAVGCLSCGNEGAPLGFVVTSYGFAANGQNGGNAVGGSSSITVNGSLTSGSIVQASGQAGGGSGVVNGGNAQGGSATMTVNGSLQANSLFIGTAATAGAGGSGHGGSAYGGGSSLFVYGSAQVAGDSAVVANATGGSSTTGAGGYGEGGSVDVQAWNGGIASFGNLTASADGLGGGGADGGDGDGGSTFVSAQSGNGQINVSGQALASALGTGGSASSSGIGGDGFGGNAEISGVGGHTNVANALIRTTGTGGQGGTGGNGFGGESIAGSRFGGLTVTNSLVENADGLGGAGLNGDGGSGDGGLAFINANLSGDTAATTTTVHNATLSANGVGGGTTTTGATGGAGTGGEVQMFGSTELGTLTIDSLQATANGTAGNGPTAGFGTGGLITLSAENNSSNASTGNVHVGNAVLTANGSDSGGVIELFSEGGNLGVDSANITANGASGGAIFLFSEVGSGGLTGLLHFGSLNATATGGGSGVILGWADGGTTLDLGNSTLEGGIVELLAGLESAADITASNLTLNGGDIFLASFAGGDISVSGKLLGNATNSLSFFSDGAGGTIQADVLEGHGNSIMSNMPLSASSILFDGGIVSLGDLNATDTLFLSASDDLSTGDITGTASVDLDSDGDITFGDVHAGRFDFSADGAVSGGDIVASGRVSGDASGAIDLGNITTAATDSTDGDFSVGIASGTSIDVGNVSGGGSVGFATLGDLNTGNITSGNVFLALVGQNTSLGSVTTAAGGRAYIGNASMFLAAGGPDDFDPAAVLGAAPVATGGSINIAGPVTTGQLQAAAGTDLTVGSVSASSSVDVRAGGLASFLGTVSSPTITVTSGDINIADGASLGVKGVTNLITLNATSDNIVLGGEAADPVAGHYQLSEEGDISSDSLVFNAVGTGESAPDINVLDAQIEGSQTAGGGVGHVTVNTGGTIFINGDVTFTNAAGTDSLTLNAGHRIEVNTDTGSISMTNSANQLSGSLSLTAHDIWVASASLLGQLEANPNFDGRDAALATNSGPVNPNGYVQAGGITVTMLGSSFMVQNSGTSTDFAGLSVGSGGLTIINQGSDPATVILFGRKVGPDGQVTGNDAFAGGVTVTGGGGTTTDSSVNSCSFGSSCSKQPEVPPQVASSDSAVGPLSTTASSSDSASDDSDDQDDSDSDSDSDTSTDASVHLINTGPLQNSSVIDEPITSGNDGPGGPL